MTHPNHRHQGFTLVEMLVTIPVFIIAVSVLITFLVTLYTSLLVKDTESLLALEGQQALTAIQDDLYFARNFAEGVSGAIVDNDGPAPTGLQDSWTFNTTPSTLIVYEIALTKVRQDPTREVVYQQSEESGNSCDPEVIELNPPVLNNLIYYVKDGSLRRRVLVPDPIHPRCAEPYRIQTCNTTKNRQKQTSGGTVWVECPADARLASGVKSFVVEYYDASNNLIDMSVEGASPLQAERVTLKLTLARTILAEEIEHTSELTITKINGGDPNVQ